MDLNAGQRTAFDAIKENKNVFLTGPAGSGKTFLINYIVEWANSCGKRIALTALTGCAAILLGSKARTLHSWSGIGLGREPLEKLIANILRKPKLKSAWKRTDILVIDEISMMTPDLFNTLDAIGKRIRASPKPWGGIQLVPCGDFFQLPPVAKGISGEAHALGRFAFESSMWKEANLTPIVLTTIERQTDSAFQTVLNDCRIGSPSATTIAALKSRQGLDWKTHRIKPTLLFSRNADVDVINEKNIAALKKPLYPFKAQTKVEPNPEDPMVDIPYGDILDNMVQRLDNDANYAPHLELCIGAQVMLLVNMDIEAGLVNGSRGIVVEFRAKDLIPIVEFRNGDHVPIERHRWTSRDSSAVHREQIPLRVAYAITIHKSQGATLDCALVDIGSSTFEFGQAYVALSRVRDLESLYIHTLESARIRAHPTVIRYYEELLETIDTPDDAPGIVPPQIIIPPTGFGSDLQDTCWRQVVTSWASSTVGQSCLARVAERRRAMKVYPSESDVLNALRHTPLQSVKVVLLGQDPYHGEGQAHGLSFSVQPEVKLPPSLKNIRKELISDLGVGESAWPPTLGTLTPWAKQGVLLLNSAFTVEEKNPNSHATIGWEALTQQLLEALVSHHNDTPLVFLAWGKFAQNIVYKLQLGPKHLVLASTHPSPLSAHQGFFGSKPFTKANTHLTSHYATPIFWPVCAPVECIPDDPQES